MYSTVFEVIGRSPFPIDMLRYDGCFPIEGMNAIIDSLRETKGPGEPYRVMLKLVRRTKVEAERAITNERWSSFGWALVYSSVVTTRHA